MRTLDLGEAVGPGVPTGGTANQVLVKNGATNFDTSWKDASQLPAIGDEATAREAADAALADGLAIIANGDTHAAVAAGQAVFVRSHSTLAAGLYWASSAIGTNAALSTSNLTADNQGGLNKLKGDIDSLNSNIGNLRYLNLGNVSGNIGNAWDAIDVYDTLIVGIYSQGGVWMYIGYKYSDSRYGMMWSQKYGDWEITILSVNGGTKHIGKTALQS